MSRLIRDPMKNVVWQEWREQIDSEAYAMVAIATEVWRGGIYSASTMMLFAPSVPLYRAREDVHLKLLGEMRELFHVRAVSPGYVQHRFGMPWRGWVRDLRR